MTFEVGSIREWLDQLLDKMTSSLEKQSDRNSKLMDVFWKDSATTRGEKLGRLLALPGLKSALRLEDVPKLPSWLLRVREQLGSRVSTYGSHQSINDSYAKAVMAAAAVGESPAIRDLIQKWFMAETLLVGDDLGDISYRLPWHRWVQEAPQEVVRWLEILTDFGPAPRDTAGRASRPPGSRMDESLVFAVYKAAAELAMVAPRLLDGRLRARLAEFADRVIGLPVLPEFLWEGRRAGFLLERVLLKGRKRSRRRPGALSRPLQSYDRWTTAEGWSDPRSEEYVKLQWSLLADLFDEGSELADVDGALRARLLAVWREMESLEAWRPIERRHLQNPGEAIPLARFLATCLVYLPESREAVASRLVRLLDAAPSALPYLARAVDPSVWGKSWPEFTDRVIASAGGAGDRAANASRHEHSGKSTEHQLAAVQLLAEFIRLARPLGAGRSLRILVQTLRSAALLALSDERTLLANHAAFAIVGAAEVADGDPETDLLVQGLRRAARDTRVAVRMAAAYAGGRLRTLAKSREVRAAANDIHVALATDSNALVAMQRRQGELEAAREQKKLRAE